MTRVQANLLLLLTGAVWGMGFVAQSGAMAAAGPWFFTAARFWLAAATVLPLALWERRRAPRPLSRRDLAGFALCGVALFAGSIVQQIGMLTTTVTNAGFLTGLYVLMTPLIALALFRRVPHWIVWPSACLAMVGLMLAGGGIGALATGDLLMIGAAAGFAFQIVLTGVFVGSSGRPFALSCAQFAVLALLATLGMFAFEDLPSAAVAAIWPNIVYGGCVSAGLAFTLQTLGQRWTTAPQAAIFLSSEAAFAALFGALFLGERIAPVGYAGCALMFAAMLAVELVPLRWPARRPTMERESEGAAKA